MLVKDNRINTIITHVASPIKSSLENVSLSMIFKLISATSPVIVKTKVSFHSGSLPWPANNIYQKPNAC